MIRNIQTSKSLNVQEREYRCLCSYYVLNTYASLMFKLKKKLERYLRVNLLGPGPSSYKKRIYQAAVSQRLGNTVLERVCGPWPSLLACNFIFRRMKSQLRQRRFENVWNSYSFKIIQALSKRQSPAVLPAVIIAQRLPYTLYVRLQGIKKELIPYACISLTVQSRK
jgi:hypothetical protein